MATVTAFLKHSNIGKAKQAAPYTAAAHARYIMRKEAASLIYSERMPKQYHAVQRFLNEHEDGLRKNGRVLDKFIISVPHDISEADAVKALRRFGNRLGRGEAPFLFALHGFDTRNHHAHFIFIDRDPDTGRRVYGTSERGSTTHIKLEWETAANDTFAELGYEVRVKVHEGYELEAENDNRPELEPSETVETDVGVEVENAPLSPDVPVAEDPESDDLPELETEDALEEGAGAVGRFENAAVGVDPVANIKWLFENVGKRGELLAAKDRVEKARARYEAIVADRERVARDSGDFYEQSLPTLLASHEAQKELTNHQAPSGRLKGFGLSAFGYTLFQTKARREAEQAQINAHNFRLAANQVEYTRKSYDARLMHLSRAANKAEEKAYAHHQDLIRVYGTEKEMQEVEEMFKLTIEDAALVVSLEQAIAAYGEGEITPDEYRTFLVEGGYTAELQLLDEQQSEGQSL